MSLHDRFASFQKLNQFILFGSGPASMPVADYVRSLNKTVIAYSDNCLSLHGTYLHGVPVVPPADVASMVSSDVGVIIASSSQGEIAKQLSDVLNVDRSKIFPYLTAMFAPQFGEASYEETDRNLPQLLALLADDESRRYVESLVKFRRYLDPVAIRPNSKILGFYDYSTPYKMLRDGDTVVDCGAFTGDTAEVFISRASLREVLAFEGLPANYVALCNWITVSRLNNVIPHRCFLGDKPGTVRVATPPTGSIDPRARTATGDEFSVEVDVFPLDHLIERSKKIDVIKVDVEGADLNVLRGAERILASQRPRLMVAAYHKLSHLWEIPEYIRQVMPGAKIYAGHHPKCIYEVEYYVQ